MYHFERMQLGAMKNHKQGAQGGAVPKERVRGTTEPCQIRVQGSTAWRAVCLPRVVHGSTIPPARASGVNRLCRSG